MSTPMTPDQQIALFKKWGIPFKEYKDWRNNNRNHKGLWGPVNGLMVHHTGSDAPDQRELLYSGHSTLPGPLSQWGLSQDGVLWGIGNGRCNHAGLGDPDVLKAVTSENYGDNPPTDNEALVDGNARFYGVEIWYNGNHTMTTAQRNTMYNLGAAVCDFHDWSAKSVIGHGEWQPGKWDPGYTKGKMMDMSQVRTTIALRIKAGPGKVLTPPPTTPPPVAKPTKAQLLTRIAAVETTIAALKKDVNSL